MVKRVFNFVYREVKGLHQAAFIIALFAVGSQFLAVIRDRLLAHTFGAGSELDLYYAAFRIPDLLYVLFASVLSIYVLLPFVEKYRVEKGKHRGSEVLSQVFSIFLVAYTVIAAILALTAPFYVSFIFPGLVEYKLTLVLLMQILLLQPFLLGISSLCGVITQMNHRFILYALSPLLYNLGIIFGIWILYPIVGLKGLAFGVVLGALGHLLIQLPFVRYSDYAFSVTSKIDWSLIKKMLVTSVPRAVTLSINQIVLLVMVSIATVMTAGSVAVFQLAFNLQSVPLAIIGMSYSVAAFPALSHLYAKRDSLGFNLQLLTALRHIIFWSIPVIGLVIVLRAQIVRVLLGSGHFDWSDTRLTAAVLAIFVVSLVAQAILLLMVRAFYATGRTALPLVVVSVGAGISIVMAIWLKFVYENNIDLANFLDNLFRLGGVTGAEILVLPIAFVAGQFIQLLVLMSMSVKSFKLSYRPLYKLFVQSSLASLAGAFTAYITLIFVVGGINQDTFIGIFLQGLVAGITGLIAIVIIYAILGSKELKEIYRSFHIRILKTDVVAPQKPRN